MTIPANNLATAGSPAEGATESGDQAAPPPSNRNGHQPFSAVAFAIRYALQIFTVVAYVVVAIVVPNFRRLPNLQNVALQSSFAGLSAAGMTLLIIGGMIDLSVAGIIALAAVTLATLLPIVSIPLAIAAALLVGALLGLLNGVIVTKLHFPPFIATYAMLNVYLATAFALTKAQTLGVTNETFLNLSATQIAGLPLFFMFMLLAAVVCFLLLNRTRFGRNLRAIGSSESASRMAGLGVDGTRIIAFVVFGVLTAISGIGLASLLSSASADMSIGFELNVVAVAVVGGTSLLGGKGTLLGTVTGAVLFAGLNNALNLFGVASYWQYVTAGLVLVIALIVVSQRELLDGSRRRS